MRKGLLVCVLGIDGSGKSMLLAEASRRLPPDRFRVYDWRTPPLPAETGFLDIASLSAEAVARLKPHGRAAMVAGIIAQQYETVLLPTLEAGHIVITDGIPYKLWAKELAFGRSSNWLYTVLEQLPPPDLVACLDTPPEIAFQRKPTLSAYEYRHHPTREDFISFQTEVYQHMRHLARKAERVESLPWQLSPQQLLARLVSSLPESAAVIEARALTLESSELK